MIEILKMTNYTGNICQILYKEKLNVLIYYISLNIYELTGLLS